MSKGTFEDFRRDLEEDGAFRRLCFWLWSKPRSVRRWYVETLAKRIEAENNTL